MAKTTTRRGLGRDALTKPILSIPNATQSNTSESMATLSVTTGLNLSPPVYKQENSGNFSYITQIRIDLHLFDSIHNAVESAIFGGNYTIESASHFIREALREHAAGAPLKVAHENGTKKSLSIRIDQSLKDFWDTLPKRHRNHILERAIRTKLLAYQH
jgi:hypothetical protein